MAGDVTEIDDPLVWGDVNSYVDAIVDHCRRRRELAPTEVLIYRVGQLAAVLELPTFLLEDSARILSRIREVVPQTMPDQVVVVMAWASMESREEVALGVRDLRWNRRDGWDGQLHVYVENDQPATRVEPLDLDDLVHAQITTMFERVAPTGLLDLRSLEDDESFLVHPDGTLANLQLVDLWPDAP